MAIRPIDMQVMLPKLHKNDLLKPHVVNRQDNEQQMMQTVNKQETQARLTKVNDLEHKESAGIRDDDRRNTDGETSKKKKEKRAQEETDKDDVNAGGVVRRNHIDIKV